MVSKSVVAINGKEICLCELVSDLRKNLEIAKSLVEGFTENQDEKHFKQVSELLSEHEADLGVLRQDYDVLVLASYYTLSLSRVIELLLIEYEEAKNKGKVKLFLAE